MRSVCRYCKTSIHWSKINGISRPFEDSIFTIPHKCPNIPKRNDHSEHVMLTQAISRISELERQVSQLQQKVNGDSSG